MFVRLLLAVILCSLELCASGQSREALAAEMIVSASEVFDNSQVKRRLISAAIDLCDNDTNVFARVLERMTHTNDSVVVEVALAHLSVYGNAEQLPRLYACFSNNLYRVAAARAILSVEGCSRDSQSVLRELLSDTNISQKVRSDLCCRLYEAALPGRGDSDCRAQCLDLALEYASLSNEYFTPLDGRLICIDNQYRVSKRRLSVLRSVRDLGMSDFQLQYVTNAINELVAYPEADLPD